MSRTSSKRLMYVQFTSCVQGGAVSNFWMVNLNNNDTIVIDITPLTVLFCNCLLLKDINFKAKCLVGLVWLTTNHMFGSGDFWDSHPRFLKTLKLPSFYSGKFVIFKNTLGQFIPNRSPKHVITSINLTAIGT